MCPLSITVYVDLPKTFAGYSSEGGVAAVAPRYVGEGGVPGHAAQGRGLKQGRAQVERRGLQLT